MSTKTISFVKSLVERFSGLKPVLREHIRDNDEVLPYVFFGDVTRYVTLLFLIANRLVVVQGELLYISDLLEKVPSIDTAQQELRDILNYLEETYSSNDEELCELISVSFLEHLPRPGEIGAQIRELVGPNLRNQLDAIG